MPQIIEAESLSRFYSRNKIKALQSVSLNLESGKIFGLLGPNGAGKTTFVKILLGLTHPSSGHAKLFGMPASNSAARERVGYLPENHRFPEFLTGGALLDYCGRLCGMKDRRERAAKAEQCLKQVKMWEWRTTRIKKYSKGMLQRLGIAQALLHDPELVFLDEPTDGVDPIGRREIRDVLSELRDEGKTVFINSHLLSEVEMICDEVAILHLGRLLRRGSVSELTTSEQRYRIHVALEDPSLLSAVRERATSAEAQNGHLEVVVSGPEPLNAIIDVLRQKGELIKAILPHKRTLEDSFIQTISGAGTADLNEVFKNSTPEELHS